MPKGFRDPQAVSVARLRTAAKREGYRGVIVLVFGDENMAGSSYGSDRADCDDMGRLLDSVMDQVEAGEIGGWTEP